jgi:hypothetical protein
MNGSCSRRAWTPGLSGCAADRRPAWGGAWGRTYMVTQALPLGRLL